MKRSHNGNVVSAVTSQAVKRLESREIKREFYLMAEEVFELDENARENVMEKIKAIVKEETEKKENEKKNKITVKKETDEKKNEKKSKSIVKKETKKSKNKNVVDSAITVRNPYDNNPNNERKETKQITFMDLPVDIHRRLRKYLDTRSILKLESVNKRIREIHSEVEYLWNIHLVLGSTDCTMRLRTSYDKFTTTQSDNFDELIKKLDELALKRIGKISVVAQSASNDRVRRALESLQSFYADKLKVDSTSQINFDNILSFARRFRKVDINCAHVFSPQNTSILRKTMMESGCRVEDLLVIFKNCTPYALIRDTLGVDVDVKYDEKPRITMICRTTNESVELYKDIKSVQLPPTLLNYEGGVITSSIAHSTRFQKYATDPALLPQLFKKIKMNHLYEQW